MILAHSSNPVCGFFMREQVRLYAVCPMENWLWLFLEPDTGWDCCPRILLWCFRARTSGEGAGQKFEFMEIAYSGIKKDGRRLDCSGPTKSTYSSSLNETPPRRHAVCNRNRPEVSAVAKSSPRSLSTLDFYGHGGDN